MLWAGMMQFYTKDTKDTKAYAEYYQIRCAQGVCGVEAHNDPHMINIHEV